MLTLFGDIKVDKVIGELQKSDEEKAQDNLKINTKARENPYASFVGQTPLIQLIQSQTKFKPPKPEKGGKMKRSKTGSKSKDKKGKGGKEDAQVVLPGCVKNVMPYIITSTIDKPIFRFIPDRQTMQRIVNRHNQIVATKGEIDEFGNFRGLAKFEGLPPPHKQSMI